MTDEEKAIMFLKKALRLCPDDNISRAMEYESLKGGRTMFFRNGKGKVYETMPDWNTINSYDEEYLDQAIILEKYTDKTMLREDVKTMLECKELRDLFYDNSYKSYAVRSVRATLISLGYDRNWIKDMFEPELYKEFGS